jgi:hypothetical protein
MLNRFESQMYVEEKILDENGKLIGVLRMKPSGVLWKPSGAGKFYSVTIEKFIEWITDPATKAKRAKK